MHGILAHTGSCAVWKRIEARTRGRILRSLLDARPSASSFAWLGRVSRYNDPRPRLKSTKLAAYKGRRFRGVRVRAPSHRTPSISVFSLSLSLFLSLFLVFLDILSSSSLFFLLLFSFSLSLWLFKSILLLDSIIGGIEISFPSFFSFLSLFVFFHLPILSTVSLGSLELQIMQRTVLPPRDEFLKNYKSRVQTSASRSTRGGGFRVGEKERER